MAASVLDIQRTHGNRFVQRFLRGGTSPPRQKAYGEPTPRAEGREARHNGQINLQRRASQQTEPSVVPPIVHDVLRSQGKPLDAATRSFMEPRFGHDFADVRVHADARAAESARAVNATAYTVGRDIIFDDAEYAPATSKGRHLLAHELAHVVQQSGGTIRRKFTMSEPGDEFEREADGVAQAVMRGAPPLVEAGLNRPAETRVQRQAGQGTAQTKFKIPALDQDSFKREVEKRKVTYVKQGKSEAEAVHLAADDTFAQFVEERGGKRFPGTAAAVAKKATTYVYIPDGLRIAYGDVRLKAGVFEATVDDKDYNCHSFTFLDAKVSKLSKLNSLVKDASTIDGPKGEKFFDVKDLIDNNIHFVTGFFIVIYPRWVMDAELTTLLKAYRALKAGEKVKTGDVALYSDGKGFPHSGKVVSVDAKGNADKIKSKWGHYSEFEHPPDAVPEWYGKPAYYRKK